MSEKWGKHETMAMTQSRASFFVLVLDIFRHFIDRWIRPNKFEGFERTKRHHRNPIAKSKENEDRVKKNNNNNLIRIEWKIRSIKNNNN